jgi:hypothetical protein
VGAALAGTVDLPGDVADATRLGAVLFSLVTLVGWPLLSGATPSGLEGFVRAAAAGIVALAWCTAPVLCLAPVEAPLELLVLAVLRLATDPDALAAALAGPRDRLARLLPARPRPHERPT